MFSIVTFWTSDKMEEYRFWSSGTNWRGQGQKGSYCVLGWDLFYGLPKVLATSFECLCFAQLFGMLARCSVQTAAWLVANRFYFDLCGFQSELHNEGPKWDPEYALA
jgi:hypothetical protein